MNHTTSGLPEPGVARYLTAGNAARELYKLRADTVEVAFSDEDFKHFYSLRSIKGAYSPIVHLTTSLGIVGLEREDVIAYRVVLKEH